MSNLLQQMLPPVVSEDAEVCKQTNVCLLKIASGRTQKLSHRNISKMQLQNLPPTASMDVNYDKEFF